MRDSACGIGQLSRGSIVNGFSRDTWFTLRGQGTEAPAHSSPVQKNSNVRATTTTPAITMYFTSRLAVK